MSGQNTLVCIQLKDGSAKKLERAKADELVAQKKAKFISRTRFKVVASGVKVPEKVFKDGDRAVKDFVKKKLSGKKETTPKKKQ